MHVLPGLSACLLYLSRVLIGLFVCLLVLWLARRNCFRFVFTALFLKGLWETQYVMCTFLFLLSPGLSASHSKSDPFAMDPFQSTFPSGKVCNKVHLAEQRSPFFYLILHSQSTWCDFLYTLTLRRPGFIKSRRGSWCQKEALWWNFDAVNLLQPF